MRVYDPETWKNVRASNNGFVRSCYVAYWADGKEKSSSSTALAMDIWSVFTRRLASPFMALARMDAST